jgi:hypothetical protein
MVFQTIRSNYIFILKLCDKILLSQNYDKKICVKKPLDTIV